MIWRGWRKRIDEIDQQLVKLLNERAQCAVEIGHRRVSPASSHLPAAAEAEILRNVVGANPGTSE